MRYSTRKRLLESQDDLGYPESDPVRERRLAASAEDWKIANDEYIAYLSGIRMLLSPALQYISDSCLHDAVVTSARRSEGEAELSLELGEAFWFPENVSRLVLRFRGVIHENGLVDAQGQSLLYDEVYVAPEHFEFRALLGKTELMIGFREVTIKTELRSEPRQKL